MVRVVFRQVMNGKRGIANYFSKRDDLSSIKKAKLTEIDVDNRDRENESFEQSSKCIKIVSWLKMIQLRGVYVENTV